MEDDDLNSLNTRLAALEQQVAQIIEYLNATAPQTPAAPAEPQPDKPTSFEIVAVDAKPTEKNSVWTKWAWRITVENQGEEPIRVQGRIQFRDADGFALDEDSTEVLNLRPRQEQAFTGYKLVDGSIADQITSVYATLGRVD